MSVQIRFGTYFDENTTVAEIYEIFARDREEGKLLKYLQSDEFNPNNKGIGYIVYAAFTLLTGVLPKDAPAVKACGYHKAQSAWSQSVYDGLFGSVYHAFTGDPRKKEWNNQIRQLLTEINEHRAEYTAGKVYELIETHPVWENSYTVKDDVYSMDDARKTLLRFIRDPENFSKTDSADCTAGNADINSAYEPTQKTVSAKKLPKDPTEAKLADLIRNGQHQIILTGAPGTGKTYSAAQVIRWFYDGDVDPSHIKTVQFHPSYDYTDFVEGLRPVSVAVEKDDQKTTEMQFRRVDGSFMRFCRDVAWKNEIRAIHAMKKDEDCDLEEVEKENPLYFFIIDEINRADLSKVFGELMFVMESDKRGVPVQTQYSNLETHFTDSEKDRDYFTTCFNDGFFIPENVVIIGTMNDIDRSVESMDFAMRRRFVWVEVRATKDVLKSAFGSGNFGTLVKDHAEELAQRVVQFNEVLHAPKEYGLSDACQLGWDYDIAQGQFGGVKDREFDNIGKLMEWVWEYRVSTLIREYLRGRFERASDLDYTLKKLKKIWLSEQNDSKAPEGNT